jgi:hypothetical protein
MSNETIIKKESEEEEERIKINDYKLLFAR